MVRGGFGTNTVLVLVIDAESNRAWRCIFDPPSFRHSANDPTFSLFFYTSKFLYYTFICAKWKEEKWCSASLVPERSEPLLRLSRLVTLTLPRCEIV